MIIMTNQKEHYISEAKRFYEEHNRSPRMLDWTLESNYPNQSDVRNVFGSWKKFLDAADLPQNKVFKRKHIKCEICRCEFETTRSDRKICDSKKCRYVRDSIYHAKYSKDKYECSLFKFIPEDKLIEYFSCVYDLKKENINMMKVI